MWGQASSLHSSHVKTKNSNNKQSYGRLYLKNFSVSDKKFSFFEQKELNVFSHLKQNFLL